MDNVEFVSFLKGTLIKIENVINLLDQDSPKHIPAYNKMLGVQQKLNGLNTYYKAKISFQLILVRSIINYLINGRYNDGFNQILKLKQELVKMCVKIKSYERNTNK